MSSAHLGLGYAYYNNRQNAVYAVIVAGPWPPVVDDCGVNPWRLTVDPSLGVTI